MKILIQNNNEIIVVSKDFDNMEYGLIAQTITELEILKQELIKEYLK